MTFVSALLALAGSHAWWLPAWLDKVLPDLDIEGTSLQKDSPAYSPAHSEEPQPVP